MKIFIEILKLTAVTLLPGVMTLGIYCLDKNVSWFKRLNKYIKGILIGAVFTATTMIPCYFGMRFMNVFYLDYEVKGAFGPMLASPLIASIIFGWVAGLTTGIAAGIWRFFAISIHHADYLRIGDTVLIFFAAIMGIIISKFIIRKKKDQTPKWTNGIVLGLVVVSIYLLVTFPVISKYYDMDFAHQIIYYVDWIIYLSTIIAISLAFLWLNIYNKQKIRIFFKRTNLTDHVQNRLTLLFALALLVTFGTTYVASYSKAYADANSDLILASQDVINELIDVSIAFPTPNLDIINNITLNRRIRTNGFVVIACAKPEEFVVENETDKTVNCDKDQLISVPNSQIFYIGKKLYLNNNPDMTVDKVLKNKTTFKDKSGTDHEIETSGFFRCYFYSNDKKIDIKFLANVFKTHSIQNTHEYYVCSF